MMAKELILLPKRKYEELLNKSEAEMDPLKQTSETKTFNDSASQTGNGLYVKSTTDNIPGVLDRPSPPMKKKGTLNDRRTSRKNKTFVGSSIDLL